jgi:hypothetical protein
MGENKTKPNRISVAQFLASIESDERRSDCKALLAIMERVTGHGAAMWGPSIVGFDTYHYKHEGGREGDWAVTGFSPRKSDTSIYLMEHGSNQAELLSRLGRHKMGKSCLSIRRLAEVDLAVLEEVILESVAEVRRRHGRRAGRA